jgi:hypothetical protein
VMLVDPDPEVVRTAVIRRLNAGANPPGSRRPGRAPLRGRTARAAGGGAP